jgi:hypothetical protein
MPNLDSVLRIGLGTPRDSARALRHVSYQRVDAGEFARHRPCGTKLFPSPNEDVLPDPQAVLSLEDGRNLLLTAMT